MWEKLKVASTADIVKILAEYSCKLYFISAQVQNYVDDKLLTAVKIVAVRAKDKITSIEWLYQLSGRRFGEMLYNFGQTLIKKAGELKEWIFEAGQQMGFFKKKEDIGSPKGMNLVK